MKNGVLGEGGVAAIGRQSLVEWGEIPSVRASVRPYIRPPLALLSDPSDSPSDPLDRRQVDQLKDGQMGGWIDGRTEFLPILQDFALLLSETLKHQRSRAREPLTT